MTTSSISQAAPYPQTVLLFDLSIYGHHATYLQYLIRYWQQQQIAHELVILVSPQFLTIHQDVVELADSATANITFVAITLKEEENLQPRNSSLTRNLRNWQEWRLYCRYARQLDASQSLIMYFDTYQTLLALGQTSPCPFSAIYFRPTFHYSEFGDMTKSYKAQLQRQWEYWSLQQVLQKKRLNWLLSLDRFAVDYLKKRDAKAKVVALADPVESTLTSAVNREQFKESLGIDKHRQVGLIFGALTPRKGIYPLLDAIKILSPEQAEQFCLLLVGAANPIEKQRIRLEVAALRQSCSVQIIEHYAFVSEDVIPDYFKVSDIVLAPYQRHVGMSGILLLAAAAQKPVLSADYGLMGKLVSYHQLGLTVDASDPQAISHRLAQLVRSGVNKVGDRKMMADFAAQNNWEIFARTIVQQMGLE